MEAKRKAEKEKAEIRRDRREKVALQVKTVEGEGIVEALRRQSKLDKARNKAKKNVMKRKEHARKSWRTSSTLSPEIAVASDECDGVCSYLCSTSVN